jgi:hypothetical protein
MVQKWNDTDRIRRKRFEKDLSRCQFRHHKSCMCFPPESNPVLRRVKYAANRLSWPFSSHNYTNQHHFELESFAACLRCEAAQIVKQYGCT